MSRRRAARPQWLGEEDRAVGVEIPLEAGYRAFMHRSKLELDPDDERLVAVVRHLHLAGGLSARQIVLELEGMGLVDSRGQPFPLSLVWGIVRCVRDAAQGIGR